MIEYFIFELGCSNSEKKRVKMRNKQQAYNNMTLYEVLFVISLGIYSGDSYLESTVDKMPWKEIKSNIRKDWYKFKPIKTYVDQYDNKDTREGIRTQELWPVVWPIVSLQGTWTNSHRREAVYMQVLHEVL